MDSRAALFWHSCFPLLSRSTAVLTRNSSLSLRFRRNVHLDDGSCVLLRSACPADINHMLRFYRRLPEHILQQRMFATFDFKHIDLPAGVHTFCEEDHSKVGVVAAYTEPHSGVHCILGAGQLTLSVSHRQSEIALVVYAEGKYRHLDFELIHYLTQIGQSLGSCDRIVSYVQADNDRRRTLCEQMGWQLTTDKDRSLLRLTKDLSETSFVAGGDDAPDEISNAQIYAYANRTWPEWFALIDMHGGGQTLMAVTELLVREYHLPQLLAQAIAVRYRRHRASASLSRSG
jgi:hypothetical protein